MKLAYIIFEGITWLDLIGCYEPLSKLKSNNFIPDLSWDICGYEEMNHDIFGFGVKTQLIKTSLANYDAIIVPGGIGTRKWMKDPEFLEWIKTAEPVKYKISVCTGSLLLGAAGFLKDKTATTNFQEYEALKPFCKTVSTDRIVDDNNVITAGAVTSSIDLGLYLCKKWAGEEAASAIRRKIDYRG
jgi:transcriptional regulator GlxA family with amidase domain